MADKIPEVLACGASIMKDVWEIRLRECGQKLRQEEDRIQKSALEKINQDWQVRMSSKFKTPKRLEKKAKPPEESNLQAFKTKQTLGRPQGFQSSRPQRQVDPAKTTKGNKLALLRHLNESCPGLMVWAKSWKFSLPLPQPEESKESPRASDWGQSWKFLNRQPSTEGKPWSDLGFDTNNNMTSNGILFLWERIGKALDSKDLKRDLPASKWEKSWIFLQRRKESREGTTNGPKSDLNSNPFYNLWDSRHLNQENPEWHESWKSTKPLKEGEARTDLIQLVSNEEDKKNEQLELPWNTSWMYFKKQLHIKSKTAFNMSVWGESWMVSKTIAEQDKTSIASQAVFNVKINAWNKNLRISQFREGDVRPSEWDKSWVTIKNRSEYREETNKVEHPEETMEEPKKMDAPMSNPPMEHEHIKFYVLASPKKQKRHEMLNASGQNNKDTLVSNWKESWKMFKRQRREERALRNQRRPPPQLDAASETSQTEWANSWKFTNFSLNQDTSLWQQGWSTSTQPRPNRHVRENEMLNEYVPHNGPTGVHGWGESWRSTRRQHRMENQGVGASQPVSRQAYQRSVADWEQSWESPTNQRHHDRPSMTDWNDSWRFCAFHCDNLVDRQPEHTWFEKSMEIKARKDLHKASYTLSRSFDSQSKEWKDSWRGKKRSDGPGSRVSFLIKEEVLDWDNSWMFSQHRVL
ncbi:uncharacterized protein LOC127635574 [Xyrauchen texanus]|uniref:uncharacterized protein LOC127635574 n=1 Tax=Xyrauchen texanus TaxID=154827 RepID=UPI00224290DF|nr:uncharacterized protein LOC127635574 [Xyrauchen texanus]XP_051971661.1 uncharacterized protein LOC127635574 [Xyrauchen texanus]XP_051971662.1 uncharacterized protein LOC127635574 [Xyrauchen texanus]XP_051971663.1 uncharacterized protein LOC127635574 [Xyrauchen texanus]